MAGMFAKKLSVRWKEIRIKNLQNPGKVNLGIFRVGMVAVDQKSDRSQNQKSNKGSNRRFCTRSFIDRFEYGPQKKLSTGLKIDALPRLPAAPDFRRVIRRILEAHENAEPTVMADRTIQLAAHRNSP